MSYLNSVKKLFAGTAADQDPTFTITYTKHYVPIVTLSTQDNTKQSQLKSGFKRTINCNKHQSKVTIFRGVNRLFVLLFLDNTVRTGRTTL